MTTTKVDFLNSKMIYKTLLAGAEFLDFNARKTQLVSCDQSNNTDAIDVKVGGSVYKETSSFKLQGLSF